MIYCCNRLNALVGLHFARQVLALARRGVRTLAVACSSGLEEGWVFMGMLTFLDPPRPDSGSTIAKAREFGVRTKMITGEG